MHNKGHKGTWRCNKATKQNNKVTHQGEVAKCDNKVTQQGEIVKWKFRQNNKVNRKTMYNNKAKQ